MELDYETLLQSFVQVSREIIGGRLVGIYLHGSAAMGCFNPQKSDLDLLLVIDGDMERHEKLEFMRNVVRLNEAAPAKGLELSIVRKEFCNPFVYPTPYELHFSAMHLQWFMENPEAYVEKMRGTDVDLAAHIVVIRHCGRVLYGSSIEDVFGPVDKRDYINSIWQDIKDAREHILTDPLYVTLNLCRVLAYLQDGLILSKKAGGEWGIRSLPRRFHGMLQDALRSYGGDEELESDTEAALDFAEYMEAMCELILKTGC